jgi:hypothetical protein
MIPDKIKVYMVDIDNTICITEGSDYANSKPMLDRIKKINEIYDQGHHIIYYTARGANSGIDHTHLTHSKLATWGCKYDEIRLGKPAYDVWIDDKAINSEDFFK